jgi:hypothetical protein
MGITGVSENVAGYPSTQLTAPLGLNAKGFLRDVGDEVLTANRAADDHAWDLMT